jgi:hypothetical protein
MIVRAFFLHFCRAIMRSPKFFLFSFYMKAATVKQLKDELKMRPPKELLEICLRLSKFKKENKELLTYLLFEASHEGNYVSLIKEEMDEQFEQINRSNYYLIKKGVRKILRETKKHIRYSTNKETEIELLIYFLIKLKEIEPPIHRYLMLLNIYDRQLSYIRKKLTALHEDLQFDYNLQLEEL